INWPVPKIRTICPSRNIALIRGIRRLPSSRSILQNKTGAARRSPPPRRETLRLTGRAARTKGFVGPATSRTSPEKVRERHAAITQAARDRLRSGLPLVLPCGLPAAGVGRVAANRPATGGHAPPTRTAAPGGRMDHVASRDRGRDAGPGGGPGGDAA